MGHTNKQTELSGGYLQRRYDNEIMWQKPGDRAGFFGVRYPALSGFFHVLPLKQTSKTTSNPAQGRVEFCTEKQTSKASPVKNRAKICTEEQMITKEKPAMRSLEELNAIAAKVKQEIEEEKARTKKFLAELFLQGPDAWPDKKK